MFIESINIFCFLSDIKDKYEIICNYSGQVEALAMNNYDYTC